MTIEQIRARQLEMERVEAERAATRADAKWWPIPSWELPAGVSWDVPRANQGQIVEEAHGYLRSASPEYVGVYDRSTGEQRYYARRAR